MRAGMTRSYMMSCWRPGQKSLNFWGARQDIKAGGWGRRLKEGDCACGSPFPMMKMGLCRSNDLIRTRSGKRIYPSYFIHLLDGLAGIRQYQFIQNEPDKISLNLVSSSPLDTATLEALKARVHREADEQMALEIRDVDEIKRIVSGKHRFVISKLG